MPNDDPFWYKEAVIYELHPRAFFDSNGDGIGDFSGLTDKLDYLQSLGVTALWLLPFYPSPLKDDGYDIADYTAIHPAYGALNDFKRLMREAHRRNLRVIIELVCNHTSDQHPWFQRARQAPPGSPERDFYVWSDTPEKYPEVRVLFKDFESSNWAWDPLAKAYYWHRFYSHQPDLNYDNPAVHQAIRQVVDFWLGLGVDGLRLVAIPYLYQREGTDCENLPEVHTFLKELRRHVDRKFKNRILLAEANQWPEDAVTYFGRGDECQMAFYYPLMPRLFMAVRMEDRFPVIDIIQQTPPLPKNCRWGLFLRNHDELTLTVATDTERDYMYRVYALDPRARHNIGIRRRLAPLLENNRRKIELLNGLLLSLPGTPIIYYGDEIGMGDNVYLPDRNGVRTPMQWSADRNAGFSQANPQQLHLPVVIDPEYHYQAINVETQQNNSQSLLWWMRRLIGLRKQHKTLNYGSLEFLLPDNSRVLVFLRRYQDQCLLVAANLSRFAQHVELDLSAFQGQIPVELFGRTEFPPIGERPYLLTLSPHAFYWLALQPQRLAAEVTMTGPAVTGLAELTVAGPWEDVLKGKAKSALEEVLPRYIAPRRWFGSKARAIQSVEIAEALDIGGAGYITLLRVNYTEGEPETYLFPLAFASGDQADELRLNRPAAVVARLHTQEGEGVLFDAVWQNDFCRALLETIARQQRLQGQAGALLASTTTVFARLRGESETAPPPSLLGAEQSNTSMRFGDRLILKLFRKLEAGANPDLEIGHFLTETAAFAHIPPVAGMLEYRHQDGGPAQPREPVSLAILQGFVTNQGDAWRYTLDTLSRYFERVLIRQEAHDMGQKLPSGALLDLAGQEIPEQAFETIGLYLESAQLLGQRTAELHVALASNATEPAFAPEPLTLAYQRPLHQSMRNLTGRVVQLLRRRLKTLPEQSQSDAAQVLALEPEILSRFHSLIEHKFNATRTRIHGDYHLGQVLYTGKDFMIIDFEGEPARTLTERRQKKSPLQDVAGMLRSFHYAAYAAYFEQLARGLVTAHLAAGLEVWARYWQLWVSAAFLKGYLRVAQNASFLPETPEGLRILLDVHLLEKAVYELGYELNNRPDWVKIPLQGILQTLQPGEKQ
jgi:maltose alpha-D-glucosyltransferase/alpha-amylase